ncbi:MAG: hypothetical protein WBB37_09570 [bacterium]
MKKVLFIIISLSFFSTVNAEWEAIGPFGGYLRALALDPSNVNTLYCASYSSSARIFKSTDSGTIWDYCSKVPNYIYCLDVDPNNSNVLYAGSFGAIYKSVDAGFTWLECNISGLDICGIQVHPDSSSIVYAAGGEFIGGLYVMTFFKSINSGVDWTSLPLNTYSGFSYCLALDPLDPMKIYIGGYYYDTTTVPCVFKSTDGGNSFFETSAGLTTVSQRVYSLGINPTNSDILYAGTYYDGIYRSTDAGVTWSHVFGGAWFFSSIATTPANPDLAYAGADTVIYKTTDAGISWYSTGSGHGGGRRLFRSIVAHPSNDSIAYTTDYSGFFMTSDGAASWSASNYCINIASITCFAISPSVPSTIYIYVEGYGVYKTINSGITWTRIPSPFACRLGALGVHIINPDIVYALEGDG